MASGYNPIMSKAQTLGELQNHQPRAVRDEIRDNLMLKMSSGEELFPGIVGYGDTVIPQVVNALLSRHHFILLGLRGQAKTRMLRGLTRFLDEEIPVIDGCEIHDDPHAPICGACKKLVAEKGAETPVRWLHREDRFTASCRARIAAFLRSTSSPTSRERSRWVCSISSKRGTFR